MNEFVYICIIIATLIFALFVAGFIGYKLGFDKGHKYGYSKGRKERRSHSKRSRQNNVSSKITTQPETVRIVPRSSERSFYYNRRRYGN